MNVGDLAPDFELPDQDGRPWRLSSALADGPVVVFFYPAAMTGGCTAQSCRFRDLGAEFSSLGAQRVGISVDSVAKQKKFAVTNGFDYPLLSDDGAVVARQFGVRRGQLGRRLGLPVKRTTFVLDRFGGVRQIIASERNMAVHADDALAALLRG
jgi:peroxiredoxin Q/BCP